MASKGRAPAAKRSTKIKPGKLLALALDALETGDVSSLAERPHAGALKGNAGSTPPPLPKPGRLGSSNFGVVANVCELVAARSLRGTRTLDQKDSLNGRIRRAETWLADFYRRQGPDGDLGHMLLEPLSTTYGEAHIVSALLACALGIKEAGPVLERELALCLLHRCPNGKIVSASTRAGKNPKQGHREGFVRRALGAPPDRKDPISRAFALDSGWRAPLVARHAREFRDVRIRGEKLKPILDSIRFASGPLVVTHHENGHVSRWETGPICYASPLVAVAVSYQPFNVRYVLFPGKSAAPFGEIRTRISSPDPSLRAVFIERQAAEGTAMLDEVLDISDLGPVVAEHRFESPKEETP